ncbi:hypothetical protein [Intestinibacter bartlettii]|uniref:hypothetical protein n=1 Tax=Intestinibacter bartlettii TaxID=261299 RepID=UPI0022E4234D|nr:hypothetical protein [Intestinibacter bartlettii]
MIDEFISREQMFNSLKKINYSLNCRFEKDADLYISKQDSQEIKNMIYNKSWEGIHGIYITNKISPNILSIEIMKHAWLIKNISKQGCKYIEEIFEACEKDIFIEKSSKIINNEIYAPNSLKKIIIPIYYNNVDINICKNILDNKVRNLIFNTDIRKICIKRVLNECKSGRQLYTTIKSYLNKNEIYSNSNAFKFYVEEIKSNRDKDFIEEFANQVFDNEIEDNQDYKETSWYKIFRELGKVTFDICSEYLKKYSETDKDFSSNIARYLMAYQIKKNDAQYYIDKWKELFSNSSNNNLRYILIRSIKNIYNEEAQINIINSYLNRNDLLNNQREMLNNMLENINAKEDEGLNIEIKILKDLKENKLSIRNRKGSLNFLVSEFLNKYKSVNQLDIITKNLNNKNVQDWYVLLIDQSRHFKKEILKYSLSNLLTYLKEEPNAELDNEIKAKILAKPESFKSCKEYISNYDFDFFKTVFGQI